MNSINKSYTLITGASEGLGKALAIECASRGMNLILVALPGIELHQLSSYIRREYKVLVYEFGLNLTIEESRHFLWEKVMENNLPVTMLINNAGIGNTYDFDECDFEIYQCQIQLNVMATVHITHLFLPELKKHPRSFILNVSSLCVFFYLPKKQVYGATKSFIYFFSKSLRKELKKYKISVTVLCPGGMNSNPSFYLLHRSGSSDNTSRRYGSRRCSRYSNKRSDQGKGTDYTGKWNRFFLWLDTMLPGWLKTKITDRQMKRLTKLKTDQLLKGIILNDNKEAA